MVASVRIHIREDEIRKMFADPKGTLARGVLKMSLKVERKAKRNVKVDTGRLRSSISTIVIIRGGIPIGRIGTNVKYAYWVHQGTGIYGPRGARIYPKNGKFLRFKPRGGKGYVFARSVKGIRPNPFLRDALKVLAK